MTRAAAHASLWQGFSDIDRAAIYVFVVIPAKAGIQIG
jgi:hypothetical protein